MLPTLVLACVTGVPLSDAVVDRIVSTRTVTVERQVQLEVVVFSGDPLGSKEAGTLDVLSRPTLMLTHKQTGFFQVGEATGQGIAFRATPCLRLDGKIGLECDIQVPLQSVIKVSTARGVIPVSAVGTQANRAKVVLTSGVPHKVRMSAKSITDQTWVELKATVVSDLSSEPVGGAVRPAFATPPQVIPAGAVVRPTPTIPTYIPAHMPSVMPAALPPAVAKYPVFTTPK